MGPDLLAAMTSIAGGRTFPVRDLKKIGDVIAEPPSNCASNT